MEIVRMIVKQSTLNGISVVIKTLFLSHVRLLTLPAFANVIAVILDAQLFVFVMKCGDT